MKEKIIASFKAKFPDVNLSNKRVDELSARLEGKITDEAQIDAKLEELNDILPFSEIAKQDDTLANLANKMKKAGQTQKPETVTTEIKEAKDETPEWAKSLFEEIKNLKSEKVATSRKQVYKNLFGALGNEKLKNAMISKFDRLSFSDDDDFNSFVEQEKITIEELAKDEAHGAMTGTPSLISYDGSRGDVSPLMKNYLSETEKKQTHAISN